MRRPISPDIQSSHVIDFCKRVVPGASPVYVPHEPLPGRPLRECFPIVEAQVAEQGGDRVLGWSIWEIQDVFIEAEFHAVWRDPDGGLHDLTPHLLQPAQILFVPDASREYRGCQVDNIRQPLADDLDVVRFLYLAKRRFEILNAGDRAFQHGEIALPPKALKAFRKIESELLNLQSRLGRRYP